MYKILDIEHGEYVSIAFITWEDAAYHVAINFLANRGYQTERLTIDIMGLYQILSYVPNLEIVHV